MNKMTFQASPTCTLGVEIELALVDVDTMALKSAIGDVLENIPEKYANRIKPELMQCYVEINTEICQTVQEAEEDLHAKLGCLERVTDDLGLRLLWTGTHPFCNWQEQVPTPNERYARLLEILQDIGRQLVTFGVHVHVGVDSGDKAVMICDRILRHLPVLLAISCNSPWWNNRATGMLSQRSQIMDTLPTAGLPSLMRNWSEYVWLVNHLLDTGFIRSIRDIWWDVRPHHNFGTVEVRTCDTPGTLQDTLGLVALIQCLVQALSDQIDEGTYQHDCHPMLVQQNKWRAARYGLGALLVDSYTHEIQPAREVVARLVDKLRGTAQRINCVPYLDRVLEMASGSTWAERQLEILGETGDSREVVKRMIGLSRLTPGAQKGAAGKDPKRKGEGAA